MSQLAKWLLILLLFLYCHIAYLILTVTTLSGGSTTTTVLPFGDLTQSRVQGLAHVEILIALLVLFGFSISLLRDSR